ncbi:hypothetical protein MXD61_11420 [Frankia sp. AgPm24]|uniref:arsenate reductase/protein-tyrosine-phosphatase family protein n=1 Tax=Frankia sp. AgPm24 TaxID=631128 RepID=UPI0020108D78|nr:hypothetical protein [Frankia sp. AgPm24]MCK9922481.1 hypothetical protein [Frankia sp. AgPm24]
MIDPASPTRLDALTGVDPATVRALRASADRLAYDTTFTAGEVEEVFVDSYARLARTAQVTLFLPTLAERLTRERLEALGATRGLIAKRVPEVLFVCVRNAGRSQIAAAFTRHYAGTALHIRTGGSDPGEHIHPEVIAAMKDVGLSLVAKRVDIYATAIHHHMTVDAVNDLDLAYTPPLGSPWDAVQIAAQTWLRDHHGTRRTTP